MAIVGLLMTAGMGATSDFRLSKQNTTVVSQKKTSPKKPKSVKPKKDIVSQKAGGPAIKLEFPPDGLEVRGNNGIMLKGTIGDPSIESATLLLNDVQVPIKVQNGHFSRKIFLPGRLTTFRMMAKDKSGAIGYSDLHKVLYFKGSNQQPGMGVGPDIEKLMQGNTSK